MTFEALVDPQPELPRGEARFIRPSEAKSLVAVCEADGYVTVDVPELRPALRGRLGWLLEEAIERSLDLRGACGSGLGPTATLEHSLVDQIYRARLIGGRGLTIALPSLEGITNRSGALDADDSATLKWWINAARQRPIRLYLDVADCMLGAYVNPITLTQLMQSVDASTESSPPVVVEWVDCNGDGSGSTERRGSSESTEMLVAAPIESDVVPSQRPLVTDAEQGATDDAAPRALTDAFRAPTDPGDDRSRARTDHDGDGPRAQATAEVDAQMMAVSSDASDDALPTETALSPLSPSMAPASMAPPSIAPPSATLVDVGSLQNSPSIGAPPISVPSESNLVISVGPGCTDEVGLTPVLAPAEMDLLRASSPHHDPPGAEGFGASMESEAARTREVILPIAHPPTIPAPSEVSTSTPTAKVSGPLHADAPNAWRSWMQRLDSARGPKPLSAIEQLFVNAYVPLADARERGIAGPEAKPVLEYWAASFAKSYSEAFEALRVRGRRPMMVLDIPDAAQRLARLHGARSVQLILVDGMRFDLGMRLEARLADKLGQQAALTDRFLLWSALPTTTAQQLELIARGAEGLRDGDLHSDTPVLVARGRSASTLRRVRAGSRELMKLDIVEARLGEPGIKAAERLDLLAEEAADALASTMTRLAPRTLVAVFGDHGFCLDPAEGGTTAMRQGGASPEEVLVPGYAWLVGQTH